MTRLAKHLVLSTAHLTRDVAATLEEMEPDREGPSPYSDWRGDIVCLNHAYGFWIRTISSGHDRDDHAAVLARLPDCLAGCLRHATRYGAAWIMFDRDEPAIPEVAAHEW